MQKTLARYGADLAIRPTLDELIDALESDPKQFPKKKGALRKARSVSVTFADGISWRAVFTLDEAQHVVTLIALGPHDDAYFDARKRI